MLPRTCYSSSSPGWRRAEQPDGSQHEMERHLPTPSMVLSVARDDGELAGTWENRQLGAPRGAPGPGGRSQEGARTGSSLPAPRGPRGPSQAPETTQQVCL